MEEVEVNEVVFDVGMGSVGTDATDVDATVVVGFRGGSVR